MKKTITTLVFAIIVLITNAQTPNWQWAKNANGTLWDEGISCSADTKGNIFVTGHFASSSITFGTTTLTNMGSFDMFMVKYDSTGNVLWAKSAGGTSSDEGRSCSADAAGNIYVTGYFESSSITFGTTTLTNVGPVGTYDMFMVKYDSIGNVLWAKSAAGTSYNEGYGCSADANGNIFVTGSFTSSSITFGTTSLTNMGAGYADMFIAKLEGSSTSITEINKEIEVAIFPNPTSGEFNVSSSKFKIQRVEIYNVYGEKIYSTTLNAPVETLNLSDKPSGIYFLHLKTEQGRAIQKLIIQK